MFDLDSLVMRKNASSRTPCPRYRLDARRRPIAVVREPDLSKRSQRSGPVANQAQMSGEITARIKAATLRARYAPGVRKRDNSV
jgi:hypothetical protein